uniref:small integral membrane protein 17 isoform X3 n=1 Tax=Ictidomys tridecemlineatus TaxID=43179 RepID=UPI001A9FDA57|nr:small integral membrane protein 17 isoform X3 [Ictidomys tridecemlineatus]
MPVSAQDLQLRAEDTEGPPWEITDPVTLMSLPGCCCCSLSQFCWRPMEKSSCQWTDLSSQETGLSQEWCSVEEDDESEDSQGPPSSEPRRVVFKSPSILLPGCCVDLPAPLWI